MLREYSEMLETALADYLSRLSLPLTDRLKKAMSYSLLSGGKRVRPALLLEFYKLCGGIPEKALPFACAVEMIHTYSLIHDDLPCMDDDIMRRGKPSCHMVFGEDIALLAGDALLTLAFESALSAEGFDPEKIVKAAYILAKAAGMNGMVGGQVIDIETESGSVDLETLQIKHRNKTGALIKACAQIGCILAGASETQTETAASFAAHLGLAFQIVDDILNAEGDSEILGKPTGSDAEKGKTTYVSLLGLEKSRELVGELTGQALELLDKFEGDAGQLRELTVMLQSRQL
ncbi:MAG TPA: geranyl transferase [Ruminococcaceae bacterium]|nr:geranyl transferase [Oscillospiraceae bacterium]